MTEQLTAKDFIEVLVAVLAKKINVFLIGRYGYTC
jgi:hypothetical protein